MTASRLDRRPVQRRAVLGATGAGAMAALAGCGDGGDGTPSSPSPSGDGTATGQGAAGAVLARVDQVPVGAGAVVDGAVVVTQPSAGEFKAFSAVCTHQGCTVRDVAEGEIRCPCHGSRFAIEDGAVLNGPATAPLPEIAIEVEGEQIRRR